MTLSSADLAQIRDMTGRLAREVIEDAVRGKLPVPVKRPATVAAASLGSTLSVKCDGDSTPITAINATNANLLPGMRVLVEFIPPHGVFATNVLGLPREPMILRAVTDGAVALWTTPVPPGYTHLKIRVTATSTTAAQNEVFARFNGDAGNNYFFTAATWRYGNAPGAPALFDSGAVSAASLGICYADSLRQMLAEATVPLYAGATYHKTVQSLTGWITQLQGDTVGHRVSVWDNPAPITEITISSQVPLDVGGLIEVWLE